MRRINYASTVGRLMYAMLCTRPNICYAIGIVSRYQVNLEYEAAKEVVWLRMFFIDLKVVLNMSMSTTHYCGNSGAMTNSKEPRSHKRGKHIERKYHLIWEIAQRGDMIVTQIPLEHNVVDLFTKALMAKIF